MSKYLSINELDTFDFHDARFRSIEIDGENMIWELEQVNVTTSNSQNDLDIDMEAGVLLLTTHKLKPNGILTRGKHII